MPYGYSVSVGQMEGSRAGASTTGLLGSPGVSTVARLSRVPLTVKKLKLEGMRTQFHGQVHAFPEMQETTGIR